MWYIYISIPAKPLHSMLNSGGFFFFPKGICMRYTKLPLTYEEQADLLIGRGLLANKDILIQRLKAVSYYRLSGYWYPFINEADAFYPNTNLEKIWRRYIFDRQFRLLVMDGIERIEVSVRTNLIYQFVHKYGPFGYEDEINLPNLDKDEHDELLKKFAIEQKRSKEKFVTHFKYKYGDCHKNLPLWMAAEVMTFGMMLTLFKGSDASIKQLIANEYGIRDVVLRHWLYALNAVRNICAHHGRLWNRELGVKPFIPKEKHHPEWHQPVEVKNNRAFAILTIIKYMIDLIAPQSQWSSRLTALFDEYPDVPLVPMGFPESWQDCPIWRTN